MWSLMGSIYKRGNVWWIAYVRDGQQFCESSRNRATGAKGTHADGTRLLQLREGDVAKGLPVSPEIGRMLFSEALQDVLRDQKANARRAIDSTQRRIDLHLLPYFKSRRIAEVTTTQVRAYVEHRREAGATAATINRELSVIRRAFRLAHRAGNILALPYFEFLDESRNVRQGFLEPAEFKKVHGALSPAVYADVAALAYTTGWRVPSEVLQLTWAQVDLKSKLLRIEPGTTKAGEGRQFPITSQLEKILKRRKRAATENSPLVFHDDGKAIHRRTFVKHWTAACVAAGLEGRIPHDMRRSAVRNLERLAIPRKVAMQMVGHKTESIYRRYHIIAESDIRAAGAKLPRWTPKSGHRSTPENRPPRIAAETLTAARDFWSLRCHEQRLGHREAAPDSGARHPRTIAPRH
jgi:integrase